MRTWDGQELNNLLPVRFVLSAWFALLYHHVNDSLARFSNLAPMIRPLLCALLADLLYLPAEQPQNRVELAKAILLPVPVGGTHFFLLPAKDTPELRAIARDWPSRVADYQAFTNEVLRK